MSVKNLKNFYQFIGQNSAIRSQLDKLPDQASFIKRMVQLGAENGFEFTADELESAIADAESPLEDSLLSDEQLSSVAGGAKRVGSASGDKPETSCQSESRWLDPFCTDPPKT